VLVVQSACVIGKHVVQTVQLLRWADFLDAIFHPVSFDFILFRCTY